MISTEYNVKELLNKLIDREDLQPKIVVIEEVDKEFNDCTVSLYENENIKYYNIKLNIDDTATMVIYPKLGSTAIMHFFDTFSGFITNISEVEGYYIGNQDNSFLDLMNDLFTAISNIQLQHPYGPTTPKSVTNQTEFDAVQNKFKNLFLK